MESLDLQGLITGSGGAGAELGLSPGSARGLKHTVGQVVHCTIPGGPLLPSAADLAFYLRGTHPHVLAMSVLL